MELNTINTFLVKQKTLNKIKKEMNNMKEALDKLCKKQETLNIPGKPKKDLEHLKKRVDDLGKLINKKDKEFDKQFNLLFKELIELIKGVVTNTIVVTLLLAILFLLIDAFRDELIMVFYAYFNTLMWSMFIGQNAILLSFFPAFLGFHSIAEKLIASRLKRQILLSFFRILSIIMLFLLFLLFYVSLINSPVYNSQTSSPIYFGVIDCISNSKKDVVNVNISLSNPLDHDVVITSIRYAPKDMVSISHIIIGEVKMDRDAIKFSTSTSNKTLMKKNILIISMELNKTKISKSYNFIHLMTTEGTIPIEIPKN